MPKLSWAKSPLMVGMLGAIALLAAVACGPSATSTPTPAPATNTPVPAAPTNTPAAQATATPTRPATSTTPVGTPTNPPTPTAVPTPTSGVAPTPVGATRGGIYNRHLGGDPPTFDVQATTNQTTTDHTHMTHSRLVRYNTIYEPDNLGFGKAQFRPDLAKSWSVTADGKTWTFKLRDDVKWPNVAPLNGRAFVCQDVPDSFTRMRASPRSLFITFFEEAIDMKCPDATTLVMTLKSPLASWLHYVANGEAAWIVSKQFVDAKGADYGVAQDSLVGTGGFLPSGGQKGVRYTYDRNPNYFDKPWPYLDKINLTIIPDATTALAAFISGQLDVLENPAVANRALLEAQVKGVKKTSNEGIEVTTGSIQINMKNPKFKDVRVRQAMALAFDQQRYIKDIELGQAYQQACFPRVYMGQNATLTEAETKAAYGFDLTKAKSLLTAAGVTTLSFDLLVATGTNTSIAEFWVPDLAKIGITAKIVTQPAAEVRRLSVEGTYEVTIQQHTPGLDPDKTFNGFITNGSTNFMHWSDPKVDAWFAQQKVQFDATKRSAIVLDFVKYCAEQMPMIPHPVSARVYYAQPWVFNYQPRDTTDDEPRENYVWIKR